LIGIWSLAVYAASAMLILFAARRWVLPVRPRTALLLAAAPLLFTGRATLTGDVYAPIDILYAYQPFASIGNLGPARMPLLSDVICSMIPWQQAVRDALTHGRFPLWNPSLLAGEPLLAMQQPAALHPATWISLILPAPQAWTLQLSLRLLIALLAAYLLLRGLGCSDGASLLGAAAWAFSDFMIFWIGYPVSSSVGPFPFLALGLDRLARDADRPAAVLTTVALVLIVVGGHPEMLLFSVTAGGIWFLFRLAGAEQGRRARAVRLSLLAGALALGLTAVQLVPFAEALPQTWERVFRSEWYAHQKKSVDAAQSARRVATIVVPFAYGVSGQGRAFADFGTPAAYAGAILFPLAWTGFFDRRAPRGALAVLGLVGAALWARLIGVTDAVGRLPLFDVGILDYMVFATVFAIAVLAAFGTDRLARGEGRREFLVGAAATAIVIAAIYRLRAAPLAALDMPRTFRVSRLAWELVPLVAAAAVVAAGRRIPAAGRTTALLGVLLVSRVAEAGSVYPTLPASAFYPRLPVLEAIPRGAADRIVGLGPILVPNAATMYGLEDVRGYESMTFRPLYETYRLWCRPLGAWYNIVDDLRRPFLSFLNVRWAVVAPGSEPPPGWSLRARTPGGDLLENGAALPRAFVPRLLRSVPDRLERLDVLATIDDFAERGIVAENVVPNGWTRNGEATVSVERYRPPAMTLAVDAREPSVIATSVTAWKGWKARLDGERVEPLTYNHAFLGFRVPPGRHRIELRYLPDGFRAGMIVSLLTLAGSVFLLRRTRPEARRRSA